MEWLQLGYKNEGLYAIEDEKKATTWRLLVERMPLLHLRRKEDY